MTVIASAITPLLIILGAGVGVGCGCILLIFTRQPSRQEQRERDLAIARDTARRTFDQTLAGLIGPAPDGARSGDDARSGQSRAA